MLEKWEECGVNEDYYSTCDSLNSSGFVLLHPKNYKVTVERFFVSISYAKLFKPLFKQCQHS